MYMIIVLFQMMIFQPCMSDDSTIGLFFFKGNNAGLTRNSRNHGVFTSFCHQVWKLCPNVFRNGLLIQAQARRSDSAGPSWQHRFARAIYSSLSSEAKTAGSSVHFGGSGRLTDMTYLPEWDKGKIRSPMFTHFEDPISVYYSTDSFCCVDL